MDSRIYILTHKRLTGQLSAAENTELERLSLSPELRTISEEISYIWNISNSYFPTKDWNKEGAKKAFLDKLRENELSTVVPKPTTPATPVSAPPAKSGLDWRYIAGIAAVVALAIWGLTSIGSSTEEPVIVEDVPYAQILDETKVWLKDDATITILKDTDDARKVALEGQAKFDVVHNPARPFTIDLGDQVFAEVLGTTFTARSTHGDQNGKIVVLEGRVKLYSDKNDGYAMILEAGESGELNLDREILRRGSYDMDRDLYKRSQSLIFRDKPLPEVFESLGHHYGVDFEVDEDMSMTCLYTANIPAHETISDVLVQLQAVHSGIQLAQQDRSVISVAGGCFDSE